MDCTVNVEIGYLERLIRDSQKLETLRQITDGKDYADLKLIKAVIESEPTSGEFLQLLQLAEDDTIDQKMINDTLEGIECELEEKADAYANIIDRLTSDAEMIGRELERLSYKKKTIESNISSMKRNLENAMQVTGKRKFKTLIHSYNIQKNTPQEPKLDRKELMKRIKETGPCEYAELVQTESLRIR